MKLSNMYLPLTTALNCLVLLLTHEADGNLLSLATPAVSTSEIHPSTSVSSHGPVQTLLDSITPKSPQSQLPQKGVSCKDLVPDALEGFADVPPLSQVLIQASLALALQSAGCRWHAKSLVLDLYRQLGEVDANALLFMMTRAPGSSKAHGQSSGNAVLRFNLDQLAGTEAWLCKGLTRINGSLLHGRVHGVYTEFLAAAAACLQLKDSCAGVISNGTGSFQVVDRDGSYFLPHHDVHCWLNQCHSYARNRRSTPVECVGEKERQVYAVVEWLPMVSTFYNFGTSIYYATQNCTDVAKERAVEGAMDLGYDAVIAMTGGAGGIVGMGISAAIKPGVKSGVRALISYFSQQKETYSVPSNYSGPVTII